MASGYDKNSQSPFKLMRGRLGVYKPSREKTHQNDIVDNQEDRLY